MQLTVFPTEPSSVCRVNLSARSRYVITLRRYRYIYILEIMSVAQAAYVEPLPLEGYIFVPDVVLDWIGFGVTLQLFGPIYQSQMPTIYFV